MKIIRVFLLATLSFIITTSCQKKSSTEPADNSSSNNNSTNTTTPTLDTAVNINLVLVAQASGAPENLVIWTKVKGVATSSTTYTTQTIPGGSLAGVHWYSSPPAPNIANPCNETYVNLVMKFSRTDITTIDISYGTSIRNCDFNPSTGTLTNNAGTFAIDRTCTSGKWVILCSK